MKIICTCGERILPKMLYHTRSHQRLKNDDFYLKEEHFWPTIINEFEKF